MKKILVCIAIAAIAIGFASCGTNKSVITTAVAQRGSDGKVREWQSQGFSLTGAYSTLTMADALDRHNNIILSDMDRFIPVFGTGTDPQGELSTARLYALNDAAISYATAAGSAVSGAINRAFSNFTEQGTKLQGAYTQKVAEYITPHLKESVSVKRNSNRGIEVEVFYIIDELNAAKIRKDAMNKALQETATEQLFGNAVDEWVKAIVNPSNAN